MDSPRRSSFMPAFNLLAMAILLLRLTPVIQGSGVFAAKRRYGAGTPIADLLRHDALRHARRLSARPIDVQLGGGMMLFMWFADVAIGTPPKHFQLHIDTGSPVTWVDSDDCIGCIKSNDVAKLETYNPKLSTTARIVMRNESLCDNLHSDIPRNSSSEFCDFKIGYLDNSYVRGYYVTDLLSFNQVSSNPTAGLVNVTFGCTTMKTGADEELALDQGVEGLLGLSWTENSILIQMASAGKMRKEFAHCLDSEGGIFAIGHVVKPKVMTVIPLLQDGSHHDYYVVSVTAIEVGDHSHIHQYAAILDTGSAMFYLPEVAYNFAIEKIFLKHPNLRKEFEAKSMFQFLGCVDAEFPTINVQVNMSHELKLYPHNYFFQTPEENIWVIGIRRHHDERIIFGDFALRNKLFVFDIENKQIGWQEYNCSSSIELEDGDGVCNIDAHNMPNHPSA